MLEESQEKEINQEHDKSYKVFLTHKKSFIELLQSFVAEEWVKIIDEEALELVNKSFILKDYEDREADIVYRLNIKGKEVYFYVLLELQSTVDFTMPFRLLIYMTELWKMIFSNTDENERKKKGYKLPAVIPMVLYNGSHNWTAKMNFKEMQDGYELFGDHILDFEYILFDVNRYEEKELLKIGNLIAAVFMLDQKGDDNKFIERFYKIITIIKNVSPEQWIKFKNWLKRIMIPSLSEEKKTEIDWIIDNTDLWEVDKMVMNLEVTLGEIQKKAELRGREEGRIKERQEIILNMLRQGIDSNIIQSVTKATIEEINKAKQMVN